MRKKRIDESNSSANNSDSSRVTKNAPITQAAPEDLAWKDNPCRARRATKYMR